VEAGLKQTSGKIDVLVLLGPNGAGKTTLGRTLERELGCRFLSLEEFFMARYGDYRSYAADREGAYRAFAEVVLAETGQLRTVVFEEIAVSDSGRWLLETLAAQVRMGFVHVLASLETCLERVGSRGLQANFSKDPAAVSRVHALFSQEVGPTYPPLMTVRTDDPTGGGVHDVMQRLREIVLP
jgi:shikimate kinase